MVMEMVIVSDGERNLVLNILKLINSSDAAIDEIKR